MQDRNAERLENARKKYFDAFTIYKMERDEIALRNKHGLNGIRNATKSRLETLRNRALIALAELDAVHDETGL